MKNSKKVVLIWALCLVILLISSPAIYAQNSAFSKLGRGAANSLTGWMEIPKNIYEVSSAGTPLKGVTVGLVKGLGLGIARTAVGLFEVITFPFPIPQGYEPILSPEYVLE